MSSLQIIPCDPISTSARRYAPRISEQRWQAIRAEVVRMHQLSLPRDRILIQLREKHRFVPTMRQLEKKMRDWGLYVYQIRPDDTKLAGYKISNVPASTFISVIRRGSRSLLDHPCSVEQLPNGHEDIWLVQRLLYGIFDLSSSLAGASDLLNSLQKTAKSPGFVQPIIPCDSVIAESYSEKACSRSKSLITSSKVTKFLISDVQELLLRPFMDIQSLTVMFWKILSLAMTSAISIFDVYFSHQDLRTYYADMQIHRNAAAKLLGLIHALTQTEGDLARCQYFVRLHTDINHHLDSADEMWSVLDDLLVNFGGLSLEEAVLYARQCASRTRAALKKTINELRASNRGQNSHQGIILNQET